MKPARLNDAPSTNTKSGVRAAARATYLIAVVEWSPGDGVSEIIRDELMLLGHRPAAFRGGATVPTDVEVVFSFGPYGPILQLLRQLQAIPDQDRPTVVHWNTEGLPDLRIPGPLMLTIAAIRSWVGRLSSAEDLNHQSRVSRLLSIRVPRMMRFRYVGDYHYAHRRGWLDVFCDSSAIYAQIHRHQGLPTVVAPWGATSRWYDDLCLERDIDVLWMGARATRRRAQLLDRVCGELRDHGAKIHIADNVESPFIQDEERTRLLNRSKIVLNLTRTWYDDNFSRFAMAAPNRSLIVSEPLLPHCPQCQAGIHYVSAPIDRLTDAIVHYLEREDERQGIVEKAYQLVTTELAFGNAIAGIMNAVTERRRQRDAAMDKNVSCSGRG
jgi:hypothetical protein